MKYFNLSLLVSAVLATSAAMAGDGDWGADAKFKMMDRDSDGKVTSSEHTTSAKAMFTKMDADKDGKVTGSEMDASHAAMKEGHEGKSPHAAHEGKHDREMSSAQKIAMIDEDGDGAITAAEHAAGSQSMFKKMDGNGDGSLSKEECREGHKKMMTAADSE
jgi:Ca2+-binding EF-hand superfamily protein